MLYKKNKSRIHKKLRKLILFIICILVLITIVFEMQAIPFTKKCVIKQSKAISNKIINKTVSDVLDKLDFSYDDLAVINYSDSKEVNSISTDAVKINKIKSQVMNKIQNNLDREKLYKFSLPLGSFTDITLLSTLGPDIEISFVLTGSVNCRVKSNFESSGLNQTIHHIYLLIKTEIITISPEYTDKVKFSTDYEIAQTVIVGSVPSTYADIVR